MALYRFALPKKIALGIALLTWPGLGIEGTAEGNL